MRYRSVLSAAVMTCMLVFLMAAPTLAATHAKVTKEQLTVKITKTATVWGSVSISPAQVGKKCTKSVCTYKVAKGTALTFKETAVSPSTWPFCHWRVNGKVKSPSTTLKLTIPKKSTVVSAVYVLPGQCSANA